MATELARRHAKAFFKTPRDSFFLLAARIDSEIPRLDDAEIAYRLKRLVATIGDGHTGGPQSYPADRRLSLRFERFEDGIAVTSAGATYAGLVGRRLVRIGGMPAAAAFDTLSQYDAADNEWGRRSRVPRYLSAATTLAATGITRANAPIEMTFSSLGGAGNDTTVSLAWPESSPVALRPGPASRALPFSWRYVAERRAIVIRYDQCAFEREFAAMTDTILRFADSAHVSRVVVDVRANSGGSTEVAEPLIKGLAARRSAIPGSAIYVLMGRNTYSSAMMFAIDMRRRLHAMLAGEPTGGTPNGYGEVLRLVLPNSHLAFQYSTKYFGLDKSGANTVSPDVPIAATIASFVARRDVVLETVLAR
ncbi:MAG: hypothetical protein ACREBE_27050 [bacterium]